MGTDHGLPVTTDWCTSSSRHRWWWWWRGCSTTAWGTSWSTGSSTCSSTWVCTTFFNFYELIRYNDKKVYTTIIFLK